MDLETKRGGVSLDFYNQWLRPWRKYNWYDFTVLHLTLEYSPYKNSAEVQLGLLGLNLRIVVWRRYAEPLPLTVEISLSDWPDKKDQNA